MGAASFFIVGSARSGTTLLRMVFNAHPDVAVPPESRFIVELASREEVVGSDDLLDALARHPRFKLWKLPISAVKNELGGVSEVSYAAVMDAAFTAFARARGKTRWGDKTPRYVEHIDFLASLWPEARFIHLIRDGRDVALSYSRVPFGPKTVAQAADLWRRRVNAGRASGGRLGSERYHELRYEDLTSDLESHARSLCRFVALPFDPAMLDYAERSASEALERAKLYNPNVTGSPIHKPRSWERQMSRNQIEVFEAIAGDLLEELGYPRRHPAPGRRARALARLGLAGAPVGRLRGGRPGQRRTV